MARKKKEPELKKKINTDNVVGLVGSTTEQAISETLEIVWLAPLLNKRFPKLWKSIICPTP